MKRLIVVLLSLSSCAAGACSWSYSVTGPEVATPVPCASPSPGAYASPGPVVRAVELCGMAR